MIMCKHNSKVIEMTKSELIEKMLLENNGYLLTSQVVNAGISKTYFKEIIKKLQLEKVAQGIYITPDTWADDLYIDCLVSNTIIFSHETALYLHGLMEREPATVCVTVPRTYNATALRKKGYKVSAVTNELLDLGKTKVTTNYGNEVRVYDMDRTVCDIIKSKDKMDIQIFQTAIKEYMKSKNKNLTHLMQYAKALKIEDKVRLYTEVML